MRSLHTYIRSLVDVAMWGYSNKNVFWEMFPNEVASDIKKNFPFWIALPWGGECKNATPFPVALSPPLSLCGLPPPSVVGMSLTIRTTPKRRTRFAYRARKRELALRPFALHFWNISNIQRFVCCSKQDLGLAKQIVTSWAGRIFSQPRTSTNHIVNLCT